MTLVKSTGNKKVNLDFNKEFINTFGEKIQSNDIQFVNQTLKDLHESDVANLIENLSNETRTKLITVPRTVLKKRGFVDLFFGIIATGSHTATGSHGVQGISNVGNFCLFSH